MVMVIIVGVGWRGPNKSGMKKEWDGGGDIFYYQSKSANKMTYCFASQKSFFFSGGRRRV